MTQSERIAERNLFVDELKQVIRGRSVASKHEHKTEFHLCALLLEFLASNERLSTGTVGVGSAEKLFFHNHVIVPIEHFAKNRREGLAIVAELFKWESAFLASHFSLFSSTEET